MHTVQAFYANKIITCLRLLHCCGVLQARRQKAKQAKQQPAAECLLDYNFEDEEQQQPKKRQKKQHQEQELKQPKQPKPKKQKKEPEEKRTDEFGRTVRYAQAPSQKIYERIQRALPGLLAAV
jgi:hypothetical protein